MLPGVPPKPPSKRRRRNVPANYGNATPTTAPAASRQDRVLGIEDPHPLVTRMWDALQTSAESRFFSAADWIRVEFELFHMNHILTSGKPIQAASWQAVQRGLGDLLISPSEKRRCGVELVPVDSDKDEDAAVSMMGTYRSKLASVKPS